MKVEPKVLFIGPKPPPYSGPELSMQQFLESELLNKAFRISFLKTNFRTNNKNKGKFGTAMLINFFKFFFKLLKRLVIIRPHVVYYPITPTQIGWLGRDVWTILLSRLLGAKVVIHLRGSHFKLNFSQFNPISKRIIGFTLKRVNIAIVQADYLYDEFAPYIKETNVETLYQAMDFDEFPLSKREDVEKGKILVMGHMTKAKGFTDILKIIPEIAQNVPFAKFYFAGDMRKGERGVFYNQYNGDKIAYEDPFEAVKTLNSTGYIENYINLGIVKGEEKLKHLMSAQLFLTASYSEGFSRSLLEAMAVGKPLAYTPVGAHREVLDNTIHGYEFAPGDLKGITKAILSLLENTELSRTIGVNNRIYASEKFSIEHIEKNFKKILEKAMEA